MRCPNCGTENEAGAVFCTKCGRSLNRAGVPVGAMLLWEAEGGAPQSMSLNRSMTLGRTAGNDIVIPDSAMSRQHVRFELTGDGVSVIDLGSLNGVYVNDERVEDAQELRNGDEVRVGRTTLTIRIPEAPPVPLQETGTEKIAVVS